MDSLLTNYGMYLGLAVGGMLAMPVFIEQMKENMAFLAALPFVLCLGFLVVVNHEDLLYEMRNLPETLMMLIRFGW